MSPSVTDSRLASFLSFVSRFHLSDADLVSNRRFPRRYSSASRSSHHSQRRLHQSKDSQSKTLVQGLNRFIRSGLSRRWLGHRVVTERLRSLRGEYVRYASSSERIDSADVVSRLSLETLLSSRSEQTVSTGRLETEVCRRIKQRIYPFTLQTSARRISSLCTGWHSLPSVYLRLSTQSAVGCSRTKVGSSSVGVQEIESRLSESKSTIKTVRIVALSLLALQETFGRQECLQISVLQITEEHLRWQSTSCIEISLRLARSHRSRRRWISQVGHPFSRDLLAIILLLVEAMWCPISCWSISLMFSQSKSWGIDVTLADFSRDVQGIRSTCKIVPALVEKHFNEIHRLLADAIQTPLSVREDLQRSIEELIRSRTSMTMNQVCSIKSSLDAEFVLL